MADVDWIQRTGHWLSGCAQYTLHPPRPGRGGWRAWYHMTGFRSMEATAASLPLGPGGSEEHGGPLGYDAPLHASREAAEDAVWRHAPALDTLRLPLANALVLSVLGGRTVIRIPTEMVSPEEMDSAHRVRLLEGWRTEEVSGVPGITYQADGSWRAVPSTPLIVDQWRDERRWAARNRWRPRLNMPWWAIRSMLQISSVRTERLQDIPMDDLVHEGLTSRAELLRAIVDSDPMEAGRRLRAEYAKDWDKHHANRKHSPSWGSNPLVYRIQFTPIAERIVAL